MPKACYIHIPFCNGNKCKYCNFISFNKPELIKGYIYSLLKEISENYQGEKLNTLYFGGGTPSLVPVDLLQKLLNKFSFSENAEITLELNPENGSQEYIDYRDPKDVYVKIPTVNIRVGSFNAGVYGKIQRLRTLVPQVKMLNKKIKYLDLRWDSNFIKLDE